MLGKLFWLFDPRGAVARRGYAIAVTLVVVAKLVLDGWLFTQVHGEIWVPVAQLVVVPGGLGTWNAGGGAVPIGLAGLPLVAALVALTIRRLRDVDGSPWFAVLLVLPVANWLVLIALAVAPTAEPRPVGAGASPEPPSAAEEPAAATRSAGPASRDDRASRWGWGSGDLPALLATLALGGFVMLAIGPWAFYGKALFVGAPFVQGFVAGVLAGPYSARAVRAWSISMFLVMTALVVFAYEGLVCIAMAAPIWIMIGGLGVWVGLGLRALTSRTVVALLLALPILHVAERATAPPATLYEATTEVVVQAPPQQVWDHLVTFGKLAPPEEWWFRAGIAYPTHATIEGRGVGAIRKCTFSTGDFVEPIEVWDEPRLLRFTVDQCPPPMFEWNPLHDHVDAAHLHGSFAAKRGQFELVPRDDGTTLLRGTTWYVHGLHPEGYWRWWSDWLVHSIHRRVLEHIRDEAEGR